MPNKNSFLRSYHCFQDRKWQREKENAKKIHDPKGLKSYDCQSMLKIQYLFDTNFISVEFLDKYYILTPEQMVAMEQTRDILAKPFIPSSNPIIIRANNPPEGIQHGKWIRVLKYNGHSE